MASTSASAPLLSCPMCQYSVLPSDSYVLELHFEQEHTPDSPFRIQEGGDDLPNNKLLPPLPPRPASTRSPANSSASAEGSTNDNEPSDDDDENVVLCPEPDCGETVLLTELNEHIDLHQAERLTLDADADGHHSHSHSHSPSKAEISTMQTLNEEEASPSFLKQNFSAEIPDALRQQTSSGKHHGSVALSSSGVKKIRRKRGNSSASEKSTLSRSILSFNPFSLKSLTKERRLPSGSVRLGRAELGPHAWEDQMPKWLHRQLADGPKITMVNRIGRDGRLIRQEEVQNETPGIIPILAQLSAVDRSVKAAYYCHPSTLHVGKTPNEGGFCGYRNIQMLVSYIQGARAQGHDEFAGRTPGILRLQDMIELAWDKDINAIGRQQTGGIRNTRKYIGTPEAQALFLSSQIDCAVDVFSDSPDGRFQAHEQLFNAVEKYFQQAAISDDQSNVYKTLLPPIYLQQPGHSLTIVGFERRRDGSCNLMTFDPMFHTSPSMHRLKGRRNIRTPRPEVMHAYRRGARQLRRHAAFEILMLTAHPPLFPAWDVLSQFPDCRYLYAFFRSRTLGYDIYPEDHFLRNFPWQKYGGLWIVDDARFARAAKVNPLTAAALRRLTAQGSPAPSFRDSGYGSTTDTSTSHTYGTRAGGIVLQSAASSRRVNTMGPLDGAAGSPANVATNEMDPLLKFMGMYVGRDTPNFGHETRRHPGFISPSSPTPDAKLLFPTPPLSGSERLRSLPDGSPMSLCRSSVNGPTFSNHNGFSRGHFDNYTSPVPLFFGESIQTSAHRHVLPDSPLNPSSDEVSPLSPRTAMWNAKTREETFQNHTHNPSFYGPAIAQYPNQARHQYHQLHLPTSQRQNDPISPIPLPQQQWPYSPHATTYATATPSPPAQRALNYTPTYPLTSPQDQPLAQQYQLSTGIETLTTSPFSGSSSPTLISFTSFRSQEHGLLALTPLSEMAVAEYRFWQACGRRACPFGCAGGDTGEREARRLFRGESVVGEENAEDRDGDFGIIGEERAERRLEIGGDETGRGEEEARRLFC